MNAHRLLLSTRSPVFAGMLRADMRENQEGIITIEDVKAPVFRALLHFIYTDSLPEVKVSMQTFQNELFSLNLQGMSLHYPRLHALSQKCKTFTWDSFLCSESGRENICGLYLSHMRQQNYNISVLMGDVNIKDSEHIFEVMAKMKIGLTEPVSGSPYHRQDIQYKNSSLHILCTISNFRPCCM